MGWTADGRILKKNGTARIALGAYYVDHTAYGNNAAEQSRAAAMAVLAAAGMDFILTPLTDTCAVTMAAAAAAGISVIPEWNADYQDVDAEHGPFDAVITHDDVDAGSSTTHPPATVDSECATYRANLSGTPLLYASGGYASQIPNYFDCTLDMLAMQAYPIGNGAEEDYYCETQYWNVMRPYTKPFIPNVQCFNWSEERLPTVAGLTRMANWAMESFAAGIFFYTFFDQGAGYDIRNETALWSAIVLACQRIRKSEAYWLNRLANVGV